MGAIGCMWLGARRAGHALLSALAYPALGLLLLTLILAYSRGSLAALMIGLLLWFAVVPLRLRGAALLIVAGIAAGGRRGMGLQDARAQRRSGAARRSGRRRGISSAWCCVVMLVLLTAAGIAIGFLTARRPRVATHPPPRRGDPAGTDRADGPRRRGRPRAQPARPDRLGLACLQLAHRPEREAPAEHARAADGDRERQGPLLEGGAADLRRPPDRSARAPTATAPPGCATATRRSKCATRTASSCRRSPTSGSSGC